MTPNLLQIVDPPRPDARPLMVEVPVNPATAPYLVSRASSDHLTMWIGRAMPNSKVRAASRTATLEDLYLEVVQQVVAKGREEGWGNTHPLTKDGVTEAIEYVRSYGFEDLEILANPKLPWGEVEPTWVTPEGPHMVLGLKGYRVQPAAWLDTETIVVVPRDREFVGLVIKFTGCVVSVVHNAARGMAVATRK